MIGKNRKTRPELCVPSAVCLGSALSSSNRAATIALAKRMLCKLADFTLKFSNVIGQTFQNWVSGNGAAVTTYLIYMGRDR